MASVLGRVPFVITSLCTAIAANAQERRAQRVRSSLLFGGISVSPPSWHQLERPRKTRTDTDGGEIATIRRQHAVDVPSFSYSGDCSIDEPQVELPESGVSSRARTYRRVAATHTRIVSPDRRSHRRTSAWRPCSPGESSPPQLKRVRARSPDWPTSGSSRTQENSARRLWCWRGRGGARQCPRRSADSSLEISEELRFIAEFFVRRLEEACRGRAAARVVAGRHHPQPLANENRGGVACRSGSLQGSDILRFEPDRRRNQSRHTFTIDRRTPERNQPPSTHLARPGPFAGTLGLPSCSSAGPANTRGPLHCEVRRPEWSKLVSHFDPVVPILRPLLRTHVRGLDRS